MLEVEGYFVYKLEGNYKTPCFNPNNSDEIIYQGITSDQVPCLIKYNMVTQDKSTILCGETILHRPRWSKKDWIIFDRIDNNIYKIKSNGDSLSQLTFQGNAFSPEWDIKGEKFVYADVSGNGRTAICDEDGNFLYAKQSARIGYYCWQHDSIMIGGFSDEVLAAINFSANKVVGIIEYNQSDFFLGEPQWVGNETFVWSTYEGVYELNTANWDISTSEWKGEKIIDACGFTRYNEPTYSYESNKLIFHKHEERELEPGKVLQKHSLVIMNPDGSDEQEIIIPE